MELEITTFGKDVSNHIYAGKKFYWKVFWFIIATFSAFDPILHWAILIYTDEKVGFRKLNINWNIAVEHLSECRTCSKRTRWISRQTQVFKRRLFFWSDLVNCSPWTLFNWDPSSRQGSVRKRNCRNITIFPKHY